jgi:hypothetical protein
VGRATNVASEPRGGATTDTGIQTVRSIDEEFGRGDVPAILDRLADDLDFGSEPESTVAPWHGHRTTEAEVVEFFRLLGEHVEVTGRVCFSRGTEDTALVADLLSA